MIQRVLAICSMNINMASNNGISSAVPLCATPRLLSWVWVFLSWAGNTVNDLETISHKESLQEKAQSENLVRKQGLGLECCLRIHQLVQEDYWQKLMGDGCLPREWRAKRDRCFMGNGKENSSSERVAELADPPRLFSVLMLEFLKIWSLLSEFSSNSNFQTGDISVKSVVC